MRPSAKGELRKKRFARNVGVGSYIGQLAENGKLSRRGSRVTAFFSGL